MKARIAMLVMLAATACQTNPPQPTPQPAPPPQASPPPPGPLTLYVLPIQYPGLKMPCVGNFGAPCQSADEAKKAHAQLERTAVEELKKRGVADVRSVTDMAQLPPTPHRRLSMNLQKPLVRASGGVPFHLQGIYPEQTGINPPDFSCRISGTVSKFPASGSAPQNVGASSKDGVKECFERFFAAAATASQEP
jgi:hypothetical protein